MTTVQDILQFVEALAPKSMAESWDNVGLLCGRKTKEVKKVLVALDPFRNVIAEAIELGADCIVTHHPLIFGDSLMAVNEDTETGRCLLTLAEQGIAAINAHTNFDLAPGGINDVLAQTLGLSEITVMTPEGADQQGRPYGLLRSGTVEEQPLSQFLSAVKTQLECEGLRYVDGGRPVRKVAVGGGSCAGGISEVISHGCDTFVTADVKYNQFRTAYEQGLNLIDAGHFHTENPGAKTLCARLQQQFPEVEILFSPTHRDCTHFF